MISSARRRMAGLGARPVGPAAAADELVRRGDDDRGRAERVVLVEDLGVRVDRPRQPTSPPIQLRGLQRPQDVAAKDLEDIRLAVASPQQLFGDGRELRHVLQALRSVYDAIEVRAQSGVIDSRYLGDMVDMIDHEEE